MLNIFLIPVHVVMICSRLDVFSSFHWDLNFNYHFIIRRLKQSKCFPLLCPTVETCTVLGVFPSPVHVKRFVQCNCVEYFPLPVLVETLLVKFPFSCYALETLYWVTCISLTNSFFDRLVYFKIYFFTTSCCFKAFRCKIYYLYRFMLKGFVKCWIFSLTSSSSVLHIVRWIPLSRLSFRDLYIVRCISLTTSCCKDLYSVRCISLINS